MLKSFWGEELAVAACDRLFLTRKPHSAVRDIWFDLSISQTGCAMTCADELSSAVSARLSSPDTDLTRQTLFTPHSVIISAPLTLHASSACKCKRTLLFNYADILSPKGGAHILQANRAVLTLSRIKCSSWIMVHRRGGIYIFIYYCWTWVRTAEHVWVRF